MRLLDHAAAAQEVVLRHEGEAIDPAAQARKLDAELHLRRRNRLVVAIGKHAELGFDTILEDGHLDREVPVAEHATAMRPALIVGSGRRRVFLGLVRGRDFATGGEQAAGKQDARDRLATGHQRSSALAIREAWRPVSRSRRTPSRW